MKKLFAILSLVAISSGGCGKGESSPQDWRTQQADAACRQKWGKGLADLPAVKLTIIGPQNEAIKNEFKWAFSLYNAVEFGQRVEMEWRDVGGGGSSIEQYLQTVYAKKNDGGGDNENVSSGIDIVWGGGDRPYPKFASLGILEPMGLPEETLGQIPPELGGVRLRDDKGLWCGCALSGFGLLYNRGLLEKCRIRPPQTWDDLADGRFADLVSLADPNQSSSAAAIYRMVVQSGGDWPDGWAKLLRLLANARRIDDSAGAAASAPLIGEALASACIDFYGAMRVAEAPDELVYVSPKGQAIFSPDCIAILKNPPNRALARRFAAFVLSARGQAIMGLRVGQADGPIKFPLYRYPIRRDVYEKHAGGFLPGVSSPYQAGLAMELTDWRKRIEFDVLKKLIQAAAVDNIESLRKARAALVRTGCEPARLAEFNRLPENIDSLEKMSAIAGRLKDNMQAQQIINDWQAFFRAKYENVAR
ncbi:MAG: extracellular solute-binding protein [Planctomycetes bacterium]|nr:extracellular solute-binding protein [Planctomycetota bacterium]